jgi:hypothetical protein
VRNSEELMVSNKPKLMIVVPLDDVYQSMMARDRSLVHVWLNGMVSPYSIALACVDVRLKTGDRNDSHLPTVFDWLPNPAERQITIAYVRLLTDALESYVVLLLAQEQLTLNNIILLSADEMVIDEWSCGYVTLTFDVHQHGPAGNIIGTTRPILQPHTPPFVPYPIT